VADAEGHEMVLKLHRCRGLFISHKDVLIFGCQARSDIISCNQGKERLFREAEISLVDVHVTLGRTKRMGIHEGEIITYSRNISSNQ
jgi:hypothetical protein